MKEHKQKTLAKRLLVAMLSVMMAVTFIPTSLLAYAAEPEVTPDDVQNGVVQDVDQNNATDATEDVSDEAQTDATEDVSDEAQTDATEVVQTEPTEGAKAEEIQPDDAEEAVDEETAEAVAGKLTA
nr:hypothetical protein [Clostridia bacterium]